jgi:hypothetical protein
MTGGLLKSTTGPRGALLAALCGAAISTIYWHSSEEIQKRIGNKAKRF